MKEIISNNTSEVLNAISGMTVDSAFVTAEAFFYFEGYDSVRDVFDFGSNHGSVWY